MCVVVQCMVFHPGGAILVDLFSGTPDSGYRVGTTNRKFSNNFISWPVWVYVAHQEDKSQTLFLLQCKSHQVFIMCWVSIEWCAVSTKWNFKIPLWNYKSITIIQQHLMIMQYSCRYCHMLTQAPVASPGLKDPLQGKTTPLKGSISLWMGVGLHGGI